MGLAIERGCAVVVLLNKWDLLDDDRKREACMETVDRRLGVMAPWAQYLRISALTGRSVEKIWAMVDAAEKTRSQKISTSRLNTFLTDLREFGHTVVDGKRRLRMHYVTQTGAQLAEDIAATSRRLLSATILAAIAVLAQTVTDRKSVV